MRTWPVGLNHETSQKAQRTFVAFGGGKRMRGHIPSGGRATTASAGSMSYKIGLRRMRISLRLLGVRREEGLVEASDRVEVGAWWW